MKSLLIYTLEKYCLGDKIKKTEMGGVCRMYGEKRCLYRVGASEGKRQLRRPRHRWEDKIKMDLQDVGWRSWIGMIWLRIGRGGGHM